jgi:hypothetical protein
LIFEDVVVPETQHAEALCRQMGIAFQITGIIVVLPAVGLDDQSPCQTNEIDDVAVDRQLALELVAGEAFRAEDLPQAVLSRRRLRAHLLRTFAQQLLSAPLPAASRLSLPRRGGRGRAGAVVC